MAAILDPGGRQKGSRVEPAHRSSGMGRGRSYQAEIFLVSASALLLEISTTRLISFKLFYYYTYLIIGFASVLGSVLTTILSMTFGFGVVLVAGMFLYVAAAGLLWSLRAGLPA